MPKTVKVIVIRTAGTNCDAETAFAFERSGAIVQLVHINELVAGKKSLTDYHIMAIPGGFSYGDDIAAGRILANELRLKLGVDLARFVADGKLIIGICNGFQVLAKAGLLPGGASFSQTVTLAANDSGKFEDRWAYLRASGRCVWTEGISDVVYFPVAHGEGKFITDNEQTLRALEDNQQVIFRYTTISGAAPHYPENPNGSVDDIAGIADPTGRILGLMPHPERHFLFWHHPSWPRLTGRQRYGDGALIFENGVRYIKKHLLN